MSQHPVCLAPLRLVGVRNAPERSAKMRSCAVQRPVRCCPREVYAYIPRLDEHTILARLYWIPGSDMTSNSIERRLQHFASFSDIVHIRLHALLFAQFGPESARSQMQLVSSLCDTKTLCGPWPLAMLTGLTGLAPRAYRPAGSPCCGSTQIGCRTHVTTSALPACQHDMRCRWNYECFRLNKGGQGGHDLLEHRPARRIVHGRNLAANR